MIKSNSGNDAESDKPIKMENIGLKDPGSVHHCNDLLVPPTAPDGGWGWVVVLAGFMVHFIMGGIGYTFGIFLDPLVEHFNSDKGTVAWAPSLAGGVNMLAGKIYNKLNITLYELINCKVH